MKKATKLWLLALALACVLSLVFAMSAFATDGTTDETTGDDTATTEEETTEVVFEDIPEDNAGKIFHLFKENEDGNYEYMASSDILYCEDYTPTSNTHGHTEDEYYLDGSTYRTNDVLRSVRKQAGNYIVKMSTDYTFGCTCWAWGSSFCADNITIDLNGNTLTFGASLYIQSRSSTCVPNFTFTNGTIVNNLKSTGFIVPSWKNECTQTSRFTFENIIFQMGENKSPYWILSNAGAAAGSESKQLNTYITLKDCTFDMSTVTSSVTAFLMGEKEGAYLQDHVTLVGCDILGSTEYLTLCNVRDSDCTFTLEKGDDGNYITNTRPTTSDIPVFSLMLEEKKMIFSEALTTDESDNTTYALAEAPELTVTPYGTIPELYTYNPTHYPFVLFNRETQEFILGTSQWGDQLDTAALQQLQKQAKNGVSVVIYLQADASQSATNWNHGNTFGEHLIDLNGKTLNAEHNAVFFAVAKTKSTSYTEVPTVTFTVKNGNIALNSRTLVLIGSNAYTDAGKMTANYVFENVNFVNIAAGGKLADDSQLGNFQTTTNITFRDCTFTLSASRTQALCYLGCSKTGTTDETDSNGKVVATHATSAAGFAVNVRFEGGTIITPTSAFPPIFTNCYNNTTNPVYYDNKTVVFAKGTDGYTSVRTKTSTTFSDFEARPVEGSEEVRYFMNEGTTDSQTLYRLGIKHEYGYLPQMYLDDPETHKIVVFNQALGYAVTSFTKFGDETSTTKGTVGGALEYCRSKGSASTSMVLLVLDDITDSTQYNNTGATAGNHTIDLNGHSVSLAGTFLFLQAKSDSELNITVKNGTIVVNNQKVLQAASSTGTNLSYAIAGKKTTAIFENVNFTNVLNGGCLVYDHGSGLYAVDNFYEFRNCKVEVSDTCGSALIRLGTSATDSGNGSSLMIGIDVKFLGGEIVDFGEPYDIYVNSNKIANQTFAFGQYEGEYTKFTLNEGESLKESSFVAENGDTVYLRQIGTGEGTVQYQLTPYGFVSAFLNLTNDLNLVWRAFIPTGFTNPSVTFTVGDSTVTVTAYTNDNNGLYLFKLPNITPARMGEIISATLTATVDGEEVSVLHNTLSVKNYAEALKEQYATDTGLCTLVDALLIYGAAAQQYVGQEEGEFVTEIGTPSAIDASEYTLTLSGEAHELGGISHFAMTLNGAFSLRVGITVTDRSGLTLVATKGDESVTYNLENYTPDENGMISIRYAGVLANELDEDVTFTLLRGEEVVGKVLTANANSYLYRANAQESDANLATLARALYAYGIAAAAYKG